MFNRKSNVSLINSGETDIAGKSFCQVFDVASHVWRLSEKKYDPTVGPLTNLWGFGSESASGVPSDSAIATALAKVGLGECSVAGGRVSKKHPATVFDFSSVAKGYGVDCVADMLERNGAENYMVEIGGEIVAKGYNPAGVPWRIRVETPDDSAADGGTVLSLGPERVAVASSGDYRNFRTDSAGIRYGHTLSPLTGRPVGGSIAASTIVAESCALADALATAAMAVGNSEDACRMLAGAGVHYMLAVADSTGRCCIVTSDGFKR